MCSAFSLATDTAALSIFDLQAIRHRIDDTSDWWTLEEEELEESNHGRILFLHLEHDGTYDVEIVTHIQQPQLSAFLHMPSGQLFVAAAEDTTGGDLEPDDSEAVSGEVGTVRPGVYEVQAARQQQSIQIALLWLADTPSAMPNHPIANEETTTSTTDTLSSSSEDAADPIMLNHFNQRPRL